MNIKFGLMAGAAVACVVMTGCKAPKAQNANNSAKPAQRIAAEPAPAPKPVVAKPVAAPAPEPIRCKCAPGTVHAVPCACGADDCRCKVKPAEPEYTLYRVKGGDMLSSICATYGLRQSKVLELNPGMDADKLYVGKKIKLPGKIVLKDADAKSLAKKPVAKRSVKASSTRASTYKGATREYVVVSGDTLGRIAYSNGITIKCLKEMNGLKKNTIRIGQKLKVPAEKPVAAKAKAAPAPAVKAAPSPVEPKAAPAPAPDAKPVEAAPAAESAPAAPAVESESEANPVVEPAAAVEPAKEEAPAPEAPAALTHTVKAGEDTVSIAIMYSVSPSAVMDLNDLKNTDALTPGQVLKLPANAKLQ